VHAIVIRVRWISLGTRRVPESRNGFASRTQFVNQIGSPAGKVQERIASPRRENNRQHDRASTSVVESLSRSQAANAVDTLGNEAQHQLGRW